MKKLLVYLKFYVKESILSPLFKMLEAMLDLTVPLVIAAIIDRGITGDDTASVWNYCLLLVGLGLLGLTLSVTAQFWAAKAAVGFVTRLRHDLFAHIQSLSYSEVDRLGTSSLITRMTSDINQIQNGVNLTLRLLLRSPFIVFGAMIMAFTIDVSSALIFVVVIPALSVVVFGIMLWCIPLYKKVQARLDRVLGITRENLTGVRVIRAFCKEEEEAKRFSDSNEALSSMQKFVGKISALMNPLTFMIVNAAVIWLIDTGALRVEAGLLTQGAVVALYNYMSQILVELVKLASLIITLTKSVACGNRIQSVFELRTSLQDGTGTEKDPDPDADAVVFRKVDLCYQTAAENSLTDISFAASRGETIGIIGSTGSGKSSLVHLIPRFYDATGGEILIGGKNIKEYRLEDLRLKIGMVPQKSVLFSGTIRENLCWGNPNATDDELLQAVSLAQATDVLQVKGGLDAVVEQGGRNLSGGQRQRLTIARALVRKPEILILDDSASALDFATDAALRKSLRVMDYNPTVFIVSQRTSSIQHADQILVLDDGHLVGCGKHDELLKQCEIYREIYQSQFKKEAM